MSSKVDSPDAEAEASTTQAETSAEETQAKGTNASFASSLAWRIWTGLCNGEVPSNKVFENQILADSEGA